MRTGGYVSWCKTARAWNLPLAYAYCYSGTTILLTLTPPTCDSSPHLGGEGGEKHNTVVI
jgi:hypothetical protein